MADPSGPQVEAERLPSSDGAGGTARWLVVAIFVLSGAAGLVYEVVWSRQLVLVFGNTTQAVSAILTGFFGGMALGNAFGGRLADRVARPLRLYAVLELLVAAVALVTPLLFRISLEVYRGGYAALEAAPEALALVRFALALLALGPATILLGATLPTLTRHLARHGAGLSSSFSLLYAVNTFGAVLGAAVTGFVLIELLGLTGALAVGVVCSATAGLVALAIDLVTGTIRIAPTPTAAPGSAPTAAPGSAPTITATIAPIDHRLALALGFAFVSGLTALGYQTLWTRLLASGTGNSTYVFTLILVVFLSGLAIGAAAYRMVGSRIREPGTVLGMSQAAIAALAVLGLVGVIGHPAPLAVHVDDVEGVWGALWPAVLQVVLPPTLLMGFSLPLASRLLGATDSTVGSRTGLLLASNTLGSIVGTFVIPFFVIPALGSPASVVALALVNIATAIVLAVRGGVPTRRLRLASRTAVLVATAIAIVALALPGAVRDPGVARILAAGGTVWASAEDEIASVQAGRIHGPQVWVTGTAMTALTVDTRLMPYLSLALRPRSTSAAGHRVRDGLGIPVSASGRPADGRGRAGAVGAPDVRLVLPGREAGDGGPTRAGDHRRRSQLRGAHRPLLRHRHRRSSTADLQLGRVGDLVARVLPGGSEAAAPGRRDDGVGPVRTDAGRVQGSCPDVRERVLACPRRAGSGRLRHVHVRLGQAADARSGGGRGDRLETRDPGRSLGRARYADDDGRRLGEAGAGSRLATRRAGGILGGHRSRRSPTIDRCPSTSCSGALPRDPDGARRGHMAQGFGSDPRTASQVA